MTLLLKLKYFNDWTKTALLMALVEGHANLATPVKVGVAGRPFQPGVGLAAADQRDVGHALEGAGRRDRPRTQPT